MSTILQCEVCNDQVDLDDDNTSMELAESAAMLVEENGWSKSNEIIIFGICPECCEK